MARRANKIALFTTTIFLILASMLVLIDPLLAHMTDQAKHSTVLILHFLAIISCFTGVILDLAPAKRNSEGGDQASEGPATS